MRLEIILESDQQTREYDVENQEVPEIIIENGKYYKVVASHEHSDDFVSLICKPVKHIFHLPASLNPTVFINPTAFLEK